MEIRLPAGRNTATDLVAISAYICAM